MQSTHKSLIERLVQFDDQRPSLPGEHWAAFALGAFLLLRHRMTALGRVVSAVAGALLVARALSGRDGAVAALKEGAPQGTESDFLEVAAPWPYSRRVRLSRPRRTHHAVPTTHGAVNSERLAPQP